ncbi:MAG: DNA methyltransferase [Candidatus Peribacteraceae bacterium]|nr:DNA methyltransferase [Candidatus Peribacteraceae bacterium]MDD5742319.1 DNA methyltransferase [Candidatus Peribacteraceae bacterium]
MKKTTITIGSVFRLGDHIIGCGDSTDAAFVAQAIGKARPTLICTDPPYAVDYVEGKEGFLKGKTKHAPILNDHAQTEDGYRAFTRTWLEAVRPFLTKKNALYCFNSDRQIFALREGMRDAGWHFGQLLIWIKNQAVLGRLDYMGQHELLAYGWHGAHEFRRSKDRSVLMYPRPPRSPHHPTQKPIPILRHLLLNSSRIGEVVYDPFLGSGSTLLAAEQTKRRCIGIELDPTYCMVVIERFQKLTGIKAEPLPSPSRK